MKGIYLLVLEVEKDSKIKIGALGNLEFKKGEYIYVGSAQSGIEQRVARHKRKDKKLFWHIDYLLDSRNAKIKNVIRKKGSKEKECEVANKLLHKGKPIKEFGCSDCKCKSHLFRIKNYFSENIVQAIE